MQGFQFTFQALSELWVKMGMSPDGSPRINRPSFDDRSPNRSSVFPQRVPIRKSGTPTATKSGTKASTGHDVKVTQVFHCPHCSKKSPTYAAHQRHIFSKHDQGSKAFECKICFKTYVHEISLTEHMKKHQGIYKFICSECGQGFGRKFQLDGHIASKHKGIDLYTCPISSCRKGFGYKGNYEAHMRKAHPEYNAV